MLLGSRGAVGIFIGRVGCSLRFISNILSPLTTSPLTPALPQKPSLNMEVIQGVQRQESTSLMVESGKGERQAGGVQRLSPESGVYKPTYDRAPGPGG